MRIIKQVDLDEIEPGAELGKDVYDAQGNRLMVRGAFLSEDVLQLLEQRGVEIVDVVFDELIDDAELQERQTVIRARVDELFARVESEPLMARIKQMVLDFRLETLR